MDRPAATLIDTPACVVQRDGERQRRQAEREIDAMLQGDSRVHLSEPQFDFFRSLAHQQAGIVIADFKRSMLLRRISRRLKALGLETIAQYQALLSDPDSSAELEPFINALTTNKTDFFRESHHFEHLSAVALPAVLRAKRKQGSSRLRIWSAGCSTGEEAWSLAMTVHDALTRLEPTVALALDVKILATDIDTEVLARATSGRYRSADVEPIPDHLRRRYTRHATGVDSGHVDITADLRRLVTFKQLNLHGPWPMKGPFDMVFCRNVVIYFDRPAQRLLFDRIAGILTDPGYLYCGHSESLHGISDRFRPIGRSIYERLG